MNLSARLVREAPSREHASDYDLDSIGNLMRDAAVVIRLLMQQVGYEKQALKEFHSGVSQITSRIGVAALPENVRQELEHYLQQKQRWIS